jgi:hypothetical protein
LIGRLVWLGLLHATWLALAVAAAIAMVFWIAPRLSRRTRHVVLLMGLTLVVVGPVGLVFRQHCARVEIRDHEPTSRVVVVEPNDFKAADGPAAVPIFEQPARWSLADRSRELLGQLSDLARSARNWGLIGWTLSVTSLGLWLAMGGLGVRRLLRRSSVAPEALQARARSLGNRLGLTVVPDVRIHQKMLEPCLAGSYRQAVLLPGGWLSRASEREVDAVLAHEVAHARRRDPWLNLAQRLVEAALFFHPAVHWLSKKLRIERELSADALAVQATGDPLGLALALESVARFRLESGRNWTSKLPSLALGGDGLPLFSRIQELIGMTPTRPGLSVWTFAAIPLAMVFGMLATTVGSGQDPSDKPAKPAEAPSPIPPVLDSFKAALRAFKAEEPQVTYEVRLVSINHATLERLNRERVTQFKALKDENASESCIVDAKGLMSLINIGLDEPFFNVIQLRRMMSRDGERGAFVVNAQGSSFLKSPEIHLVEPGDVHAILLSKLNPDSIQLSFQVETLLERVTGEKPTLKKLATNDLIPKDSSLVVNFGRTSEKVGDQTRVLDKLIVVTPRRVIMKDGKATW